MSKKKLNTKAYKEFPNPPIFDKKRLFVFFPNNKSGQTSVTGGSRSKKKNGALAGRCVVKKAHPWKWKLMSHFNWDKAIKFTIVRNPYTRFLSTFRYLKDSLKINTIDEFIELIKKHGLQLDPHLQPQWPSAYDENGNCHVDYILRLEQINEDWELIRARIDAGHFPQLNTTSDKSHDVLSLEQKQFVVNWYAHDFILFDYKF